MEDESDGSLFTYLEFIDSNPVESNAALAELMHRYEAIVRRRCDRLCRRFPLLNVTGDELTNDTFLRAVQRASTYSPLGNADASSDDQIRYTAAWLLTIAQNLLYDVGRDVGRPRAFEREITEPEPLPAEDVAALLTVKNPKQFGSSDIPAIIQAFEQLNEKAQIVIVWTLDKREHSRGGRYMNRGSVPELEKLLGTTDANIRQIRLRALKKIAVCVAQARKTNRGRK